VAISAETCQAPGARPSARRRSASAAGEGQQRDAQATSMINRTGHTGAVSRRWRRRTRGYAPIRPAAPRRPTGSPPSAAHRRRGKTAAAAPRPPGGCAEALQQHFGAREAAACSVSASCRKRSGRSTATPLGDAAHPAHRAVAAEHVVLISSIRADPQGTSALSPRIAGAGRRQRHTVGIGRRGTSAGRPGGHARRGLQLTDHPRRVVPAFFSASM